MDNELTENRIENSEKKLAIIVEKFDLTDKVSEALSEMNKDARNYVLTFYFDCLRVEEIEKANDEKEAARKIFESCKEFMNKLFGEKAKCMEEISDQTFFQINTIAQAAYLLGKNADAYSNRLRSNLSKEYFNLELSVLRNTNLEALSKNLYANILEPVSDFVSRMQNVKL